MLRKIAACGLVLGALNSHAAEQTYEFTFTGARPLYGVFDATISTGGSFVVDDLNGDGVFTLPEVTAFTYDAQTAQNCGTSPLITCTLSAFNYDPNSTLTLEYRYSHRSSDPGTPPFGGGSVSDSISITSGYSYWGHFFDFGEGSYDIYEVTPETRLSVSAVPEPQTYLMLGAGLLAVGALHRRARAKHADQQAA